MSATLELKYFNSFWLKKMTSIVAVSPSEEPNDNSISVEAEIGDITITLTAPQQNMGVGQIVYYTISGVQYSSIVRIVVQADFIRNEIGLRHFGEREH